ncbi:MAG: hypothetical protein DA328_00780 [Nitrososphaeraceae archaeon]|nr:hypothetical protein [Nitrososphaeraceae archaeon]
MKILNIEIKNFKPFDYISLPNNGDTLLSEGLFIIRGQNSMGKTSLIEAILWGIFGENVMIKKDKDLIVKSGENNCQVTITFELEGITYRIIRKIDRFFTKERFAKESIQNIPSRHQKDNDHLDGVLHFEFKSGAILFKKENEKFHQVCRGTSLVNKEMESLVGINFNIIEKTIYIRQKEVDMLALADPGELRDLLKDLFNLNEFDDNIKEHLHDEIGNLNEKIKELKVKLGNLVTERNELVQNQDFLKDKKHLLKVRQNEIDQLRTNLLRYPSHEQVKKITNHIKKLENFQIDHKIKNQLCEKEREHFDAQEKRVNELKKKIGEINYKIVYLYNLLQRDTTNIGMIKSLRDEIFSIENDVKNIRRSINIRQTDNKNKKITDISNDLWLLLDNVNSFIDKFFIDYVLAYNFCELINSFKETTVTTRRNYIGKIQSLENEVKSLLNELEIHKKILSSKQILGEIKQNSISYINDSNLCPICTSIIKNKEQLISEIKKEKIRIFFDEKKITETIKKLSESYETKLLDLDLGKMGLQLLEFLEPNLKNIFEKFLKIEAVLKKINNENTDDRLQFNLNPVFLDQIIQKRIVDEGSLSSFQQLVENLSEELESLLEKQNEIELRFRELIQELEEIEVEIKDIEKKINQDCLELGFNDVESLLKSFNVTSLQDLLSNMKNIELTIQERQKIIKNIDDDIDYIQNDILKRKQRIGELILSESMLKDKENKLRHIQFLKGEVDGFISSYVIEERLANALKKSTNFYLTQFTNGRYQINNIYSTMKKMKDRVSHGLVISLLDNFDMMEKTKDQISGGDETALGLALRIAVSKLMGNIRPFKNIDKKTPILNFIIMDEPLASIDSIRRNIIIKILTQDKSFKQIFFISHEEIDEFKDYNSIVVNYDSTKENNGRTVLYNPSK